jgi:hypothetical protein
VKATVWLAPMVLGNCAMPRRALVSRRKPTRMQRRRHQCQAGALGDVDEVLPLQLGGPARSGLSLRAAFTHQLLHRGHRVVMELNYLLLSRRLNTLRIER